MNPINIISKIPAGFEPIESGAIQPGQAPEKGFASLLKNSMEEVNNILQAADQKANEMAVGKSENLHDAMINLEKAETAFKLLVQVRNRALEAYQEIMRMQV